MKIVVLNASPKPEGGNSAQIIDRIRKSIDALQPETKFSVFSIRSNCLTETDYDVFGDCDAILWVFPVYVASLPSNMTEQLLRLEDFFTSKKFKKRNTQKQIVVYAAANCGFYDGMECALSFRMLRSWTLKCGLSWGQGIGLGGGEIIGMTGPNALSKMPLKSAGKKLEVFAENLMLQKKAQDSFSSPDIPQFMFVSMANSQMWDKKAKKNGLNKKQMLHKIT